MQGIEYKTKVHVDFLRAINQPESPLKSKTDWNVIFYQKRMILKKFKVDTLEQNDKITFSMCDYIAKRKCYVDNVVLYFGDSEAISFLLNPVPLKKDENLLLQNLSFKFEDLQYDIHI